MKTKIFTLTAIALLLTVPGGLATQPETVQGEYLEARSVSVYIGACHYGAEYVEGGREATPRLEYPPRSLEGRLVGGIDCCRSSYGEEQPCY